ncbi:MAG: hypothetical protein RUMPE_00776 [Eubacteriales bacterium SKADARSKE-1]|nr:hypothetical protein [Eubacteriales bacterium SKADARSKE-1]MDQ5983735.1 hypothetical protein [Eubacteriales bacterium SKADARSKE-1]MDQ5983749.1 hypothetical protein [Eubacteriales bacterium SKADARSKE-1]
MEKSNAYYYKVVERMDIRDFNNQTKIEKHEYLFDEDKHSGHFKETYFDRSLTGWIEMIESPKLYKAIKDLPVEDQIFISYIVKEGKTQEDLSKVYKTSQPNIARRLNSITQIIKRNLS